MKEILIAYLTTAVMLVSGGTVDTNALTEQLDAMIPDVTIPFVETVTAESESEQSIVTESVEEVTDASMVADEVVEETQSEEPSYDYLGHYKLTAYEWTGSPCANGNYPTEEYTCACNFLPLGTVLYIDGYGTYVVEDRGGMGNSIIDLYLGDPYTCEEFGVQDADIYIVSTP